MKRVKSVGKEMPVMENRKPTLCGRDEDRWQAMGRGRSKDRRPKAGGNGVRVLEGVTGKEKVVKRRVRETDFWKAFPLGMTRSRM